MRINKQNSPLFAQGKAKWQSFAAQYTGPLDLSVAEYAGMNRKIAFVCPVHGLQKMDAKNIMNGRGCYLCVTEARKGRLRMTQKQMLQRFAQQHGDRYGYGYAVYTGQNNKVRIHCVQHGFFEQVAESHWNGSGCPLCFHENNRGATQRDTLASFTQKLNAAFGGLLQPVTATYTNSQADIEVQCTKHSRKLVSKPYRLSNGENPCPQCNHMKSKEEVRIAEYLSMFTQVVQRDRVTIKPKELDILLPEKKLAIEYCGEYWHSHFDAETNRRDKHKHFDKYTACAAQGIRLLTVFESEWKEREPALRRLLRNALGKGKGKLMARKCALQKVPTPEAKAFYEKYHPQGGAGGGEHYGLYWNSKLVACMRFALGQNDRGAGAKTRTWTLGRYATRVTVAGAASRLFKAFVDEFNPAEVKSFSDNRYFSGGMYEQLGFTLEEAVSPDYQVWSPKIGLLPKSHYQRRMLQKRLDEHGVKDTFNAATDPRTEAEMTYLMGCGKIYDCGKKRWVWTAQNVI